MKKKILLLFVSIFAFTLNVDAQELVNSVEMSVGLNKDGSANVIEEWVINEQDNKLFRRYFHEASESKITNIKIIDSSLTEFSEESNLNIDNPFNYKYIDNGYKKYIEFTNNGQSNKITISYNIDKIITEFSDIKALNFPAFSSLDDQEFGSIEININADISLDNSNVAVYAIGKNLNCEIKNGKIKIFQSLVKEKNDIRIISSINGIDFENAVKNKKTMMEYYKSMSKRSESMIDLKEFIIENTTITILIILGIIAIIVLLVLLINKILNKDPFRRIKSYNKEKDLGLLNETKYYDSIPCGGDLYKMAFYISYYSISKSRSNLIGAIFIKWVFEGILKIENDNDKYSIVIKDNAQFDRDLDMELYNIIKEAAPNNVLDNNKLIRFAIDNNEKIIDWYNKSITETIRDEFLKRNISVKKTKMYMNRVIYDDALKIQGLKRYLLNFNQVPRRTELNEQVYKYLIICSVLLGVDESFGKEILRKNPDNEMAKQLLEFKNVKNIYENIYSKSLDKYNKGKHKFDKMLYNPAKKVS